MSVSACTVSGRARSPCWVLCSLPGGGGGRGAWRIQRGSRSVVGGGTGLGGRVGPWLQGELGPLGYPAQIDGGKQQTSGLVLMLDIYI